MKSAHWICKKLLTIIVTTSHCYFWVSEPSFECFWMSHLQIENQADRLGEEGNQNEEKFQVHAFRRERSAYFNMYSKDLFYCTIFQTTIVGWYAFRNGILKFTLKYSTQAYFQRIMKPAFSNRVIISPIFDKDACKLLSKISKWNITSTVMYSLGLIKTCG